MTRTATTWFIFTALVWLLVIGLGTVGSHYYVAWLTKDHEDAEALMDAQRNAFRAEWNHALDTCADTPSVDDYVKRLPWLYQSKFAADLQKVDNDLKKKLERFQLACDSFSGYCIFRSPEFQAKLADQNLHIHLIDDKADYNKRIQALQSGETPLAVFTVDSLINNSALLDSPSGVIVMVIDESAGADAMVSYQNALPNVQALNRKDLHIVLTPDSPSETLARLVRFKFDLPDLPKECFIPATDAQDVYDRFKAADPSDPTAYVLWEPYVSQLRREYPQAKVLIDSAHPKCQHYIMDVLVAQKEFLDKHPKEVKRLVKAYLETAAAYQKTPDMVQLVQADSKRLADAGKLKEPLTDAEASDVVHGISWKTARQNYAHFGLLPGGLLNGDDVKDAETLEDAIEKITVVLVKTGAISHGVQGESLADKDVCASLLTEDMAFPPASTWGLLASSVGQEPLLAASAFFPGRDLYFDIPSATPAAIPSKPDDGWAKMQPVAGLMADRIRFKAGHSDLPEGAAEIGKAADSLQAVAQIMKSQSDCYLEIQGSPRDVPDGLETAKERADAVLGWLRDKGGVDAKRMKVRVGTVASDDYLYVTFTFLKPPP